MARGDSWFLRGFSGLLGFKGLGFRPTVGSLTDASYLGDGGMGSL